MINMLNMMSSRMRIVVKDGRIKRVELVEYNHRYQPDRPTSILPLAEGKDYKIVYDR